MGILQAFKSALWDADKDDDIKDDNFDMETREDLKKLNELTNNNRIGKLEKLVAEEVIFPSEEKTKVVKKMNGEELKPRGISNSKGKENKGKDREIAQ